MRRREPRKIGNVLHWRCGQCHHWLLPARFDKAPNGEPQAACIKCTGPKVSHLGLSEEKAEANDSYIDTLLEFQARCAKRGLPWKAEIVKVLTERMEVDRE